MLSPKSRRDRGPYYFIHHSVEMVTNKWLTDWRASYVSSKRFFHCLTCCGAHRSNALTKLEFHTPVGSPSQLASAQSLKTRRAVKGVMSPQGTWLRKPSSELFKLFPSMLEAPGLEATSSPFKPKILLDRWEWWKYYSSTWRFQQHGDVFENAIGIFQFLKTDFYSLI